MTIHGVHHTTMLDLHSADMLQNIIYSLCTGRADVVRLLNDECEFLDINVRTQKGPAFTSLHLAAERGHVDTVMALVDCGASLSAVDRKCRTAKDISLENGRWQVVVAITVAEVENATVNGNILKMTEVKLE